MQQPERSFLGLVFQTGGITTSVGKSEGHALVGLRGAGGVIEGHTAGLHACASGLRERRILRHEFRIVGAHQVEPHVAAARYPAVFLVVLAAVGANDVMTIAGFTENRDLDFFQQAGVLPFEVG